MKWFWRYAFPLVFGLLIYFSIRVVSDTTDGTKFWLRPWKQNAIEIFFVTAITCATLPDPEQTGTTASAKEQWCSI